MYIVHSIDCLFTLQLKVPSSHRLLEGREWLLKSPNPLSALSSRHILGQISGPIKTRLKVLPSKAHIVLKPFQFFKKLCLPH